jgi:hemerythrin-like domain-containing protein
MQYSKAMQILVDEHEVITSVLDAADAVLSREDGDFPAEFLEKAFDFFVNFADKCHHAKEEGYLFPLMVARGVPQEGGPIGCMLHEHEQGRAHVAAVRGAIQRAAQGDLAARELVRREATGYIALLRQHIFKENNVCFPLGDHAMTPQDKEHLLQEFQCSAHGPLPPAAHEQYLRLARALTELAQLAPTP